jgi:hypothetical protein
LETYISPARLTLQDPEPRKIFYWLPRSATPGNVADAIDTYLATGKAPEFSPRKRLRMTPTTLELRRAIAAAAEACVKQRQARIRKAERRQAKAEQS